MGADTAESGGQSKRRRYRSPFDYLESEHHSLWGQIPASFMIYLLGVPFAWGIGWLLELMGACYPYRIAALLTGLLIVAFTFWMCVLGNVEELGTKFGITRRIIYFLINALLPITLPVIFVVGWLLVMIEMTIVLAISFVKVVRR